MNAKKVGNIYVWSMAVSIVSLIFIIKVWFWGSLITSSVKSLSDDCGKKYALEGKVISGNWFCSN